jgi:Leucine-rich repeat (LRR) protein
MKRLFVIFTVVAVIAGFCIAVFDQSPVQVSADNPVVTFPDPSLESAIRKAIGKSSGDIYQSDLNGLTALEVTLSMPQVNNLSGIEHCTNLQKLHLEGPFGTNISDISALASLIQLQDLDLTSNKITNISALEDLTQLQKLDLDSNKASNISALTGLINLQYLSVIGNNISNIPDLSGLTNLKFLAMEVNKISDISRFIWSKQFTNAISKSKQCQ